MNYRITLRCWITGIRRRRRIDAARSGRGSGGRGRGRGDSGGRGNGGCGRGRGNGGRGNGGRGDTNSSIDETRGTICLGMNAQLLLKHVNVLKVRTVRM